MIFANPSYDLPYFDLFAGQYELKTNLIGHRQRSKCSYIITQLPLSEQARL